MRTSAPTKSSTSAWIISVRLPASCGGKTDRVEAARRRAVDERAEEERGEADADRGVAAEQRDGDADEADVRHLDVEHAEPVLPAEDVDRAAEPGERAGDRHRVDVVARDVDAAVARRLGVEADRAHLVAERRAVQDQPEDDERAERDEEPDVQRLQLRVAPERRQLAARHDVVRDRHRDVDAVLQRAAAAEQVAADPVRDPVEHDRRDHLVRADGRLQEAGDRGDAAPASIASAIARKTCRPCAMPAHDEPTQTETIAPVMYWPWPPMLKRPQRNANATASPVQISVVVRISVCVQVVRRERVRVGVPPEEDVVVRERDVDVVVAELEEPVQAGAVPDRLVRPERVVARREHDEPAGEEREDDREERRDDPAGALVEREPLRDARRVRRPARRLGGSLGRRRSCGARLAACRRSSRSRAPPRSTLGSNSPTIRPS